MDGWKIGRLVSFWEGFLTGAMLVSKGGLYITHHADHWIRPFQCLRIIQQQAFGANEFGVFFLVYTPELHSLKLLVCR